MKTHSQYLHLKENFNNLKRVRFGDCLLFTLLSQKFMTSWVSNSHSGKNHLKVLELILATLWDCLNFRTFFQPTFPRMFYPWLWAQGQGCNIRCEYNKTPKQVGDKPLHNQPLGKKNPLLKEVLASSYMQWTNEISKEHVENLTTKM